MSTEPDHDVLPGYRVQNGCHNCRFGGCPEAWGFCSWPEEYAYDKALSVWHIEGAAICDHWQEWRRVNV